MNAKCMWCGRHGGPMQTRIIRHAEKEDAAQVCSPSCADSTQRYILFVMRNLRPVFVRLLVIYIVGIATAIWRVPIDRGGLGCFILFGGSGLTIIQYPFVTPQIMQWLGARRSIVVSRVLGAANIGIGIFFWWRLDLMARTGG